MQSSDRQFLEALLQAPSPSGYEQPVQRVVRDYASQFASRVDTDLHGNVTASVNPTGTPRIMLAGHCDQIGLIVKFIDDCGFVWVDTIGGWDIQMLIGQKMVIWGAQGPVNGVIARKAIHLQTPEERKLVPEIKDLWIDIGARDKADAQQVVAVGDPVTFELGLRELRNGFAAAVAMDDKVGTWVVMKALQLVSQAQPTAGVFAVSTVQEEIGLRGATTSAFSLDAQIGLAVDVTHATDCPTLSKTQHGDIRVGAGPVIFRGPNVNPVVHQRLVALAQQQQIPIQIGALGRAAANDANALQMSRGGMAAGIVAIPNRYMHSPVEVVSLLDLEHAAQLLAAFCLDVQQNSQFIPV